MTEITQQSPPGAGDLHVLEPQQSPPGKGKWLVLAAALLGWMFDGFEMGMFPLVARPAMLELLGPEEFKLTFGKWNAGITAGFLIGAALGGVVFGWLGDRIGRVRAMTLSVLVYSLFSGLTCFATEAWHIAAMRMVAALGMGGEWALGVALVMEVWSSASRPLMAGLIGAAANVGFLLVALIGLFLGSFVSEVGGALAVILPQSLVDALLKSEGWRLLAVIGALPAIFTFLIRLFVPESEKWKHAAATQPKNRVGDIFSGGLARNTLLGAGLAGIALLGTWATTQNLPNWAHQLSAGGAGPAGAKSYAQISSAIGAITGTIAAAMLAQYFSRRGVYFALCLLSLVVAQIFFRSNPVYGDSFLVWVFLTGAVSASFYGWLPLYLPELFPTRLRATAQGFAFNAGRIVAAGGTFVSGALLDHYHENYGQMCAVISFIYVLGLVLIWFCPETKGKPLPE